MKHKKSKKKKNLFPSKREVVNTLLKEDPQLKSLEKLMLITEHKKISSKIGLIKAELRQSGKLIMKGSMTCVPEKLEDSFDWSMLKVGQSFFSAYSLDYGKQTIGSMIKEGLKNSIKQGKVPFVQK